MLPAQPSRNELASFWLKTPGPSSISVYKLQERELPPSAVCAKFQVQAGLHDIDIRSDVDWKCRDGPDRTREPAGEANSSIVTEAVVIVFDEPREPVKERIFTATTNGPPAAGLPDRDHRVPLEAGRYADRRHRDESVELARCRYRAWRRTPAVEEARCRRDRIAKATASMARGSRESRTQDRTHCSRLRGWPGWFLAGALVEDTQH